MGDHKARDEGRSWDYDAKERNTMAPRSVARGAPRSGDRAAAGTPDRAKVHAGSQQPLRGPIFLRKTLLRPSRSRPILPQPGWDEPLSAVCLVRLLAKGRPGAWAEGAQSGDRGSDGNASAALEYCWGAVIPLRGHIFLWKTLLRPSRSIRFVAFRASHPAKPPPRQRILIQRFLNSPKSSC
jgi:hypothetical protein